MSRKLPLKFVLAPCLFILMFLTSGAQNKEIAVPSSQVKVLKTFKLNSARPESPAVVDPSAIYSNVTTFTGQAVANGGASVQAGNTITTLVADSLGLIGTPPFSVSAFSFSVANFNTVSVSARPRIRFYAADGPSGGPGTLITGLSFNPIAFDPSSIQIFNTGDLAAPFEVTTQAIWAGITFDNNTGATTATIDQLNNLGQAFFGPIDRGSSTDNIFATDTSGSFLADDPAGSTGNFGGDPLANFGWEIVSATGGPLPLTLLDFKAQRSGLINALTWSTSQERNSNLFAVERSVDGVHFSSIGQVKANGNSNIARNYHFDDANPVKGVNYYRLRMTDLDNSFKYSNIVNVRNSGAVGFTIYPNPVTNTLLVGVAAEKAEAGEIRITDVNGRSIYSARVNLSQGNNSLPLDVGKFSKGTYHLKIVLSNTSYSASFNKL